MKKFNLNSVGTWSEKWLLKGLMVVFALCVTSCSSSEDEPEAPAFPEVVQSITCAAGSESTFSFNPNMEWKLSSNKTWCTLASAEMEGQNISGKVGSQSIKVKVSAEGQDFETTKASITLTMGGQSRMVAEVVREGKSMELKIYDAVGKQTSVLAIGFEATLDFSVEANFECGPTQIPGWASIEMISENEGKKNYKLTVKDGYLKNPQTESTLTFANETGTASFPIKVTYTGMDPKEIIIRWNDFEAGNAWGWNVSMDGKTFTRENDMTSQEDVIEGEIEFNIIAINDEYTAVCLEENNGKYSIGNTEWMHLEIEGESAKLKVDATEKTRNGLMMVFPKALYDEIKGDLEGNILDNGDINYAYEQKYVLISLTQKSAGSGFVVKNGLSQSEYSSEPETDEMYLGYVGSEFSVEEIHTVTIPASTPIMVYPNLDEDVWNVADINATALYWLDGSGAKVTEEEMGARLEGALDGSEKQYIIIRTPVSFHSPIVMVFKGIDTLNKKALIIKPQ